MQSWSCDSEINIITDSSEFIYLFSFYLACEYIWVYFCTIFSPKMMTKAFVIVRNASLVNFIRNFFQSNLSIIQHDLSLTFKMSLFNKERHGFMSFHFLSHYLMISLDVCCLCSANSTHGNNRKAPCVEKEAQIYSRWLWSWHDM